MKIIQIFASALHNGIGYKNQLPFRLPDDLKFFKMKTDNHFLLMGRKTFESLKSPLKNRIHIVVTSQKQNSVCDNVYFVQSVEEGIQLAKSLKASKLFIIGGKQILESTLHLTHEVFHTCVLGYSKCDVFLSNEYFRKLKQMKKEIVSIYHKTNYPENQFSFSIYRYEKT